VNPFLVLIFVCVLVTQSDFVRQRNVHLPDVIVNHEVKGVASRRVELLKDKLDCPLGGMRQP